jgi:hypothetical protein
MEWTSVGMIIQFPTFFWGKKTCSKPPIRWYPPYILDDQITTCGKMARSNHQPGPPGPQPTDRLIGCPACKAILTKLSSKPISINLFWTIVWRPKAPNLWRNHNQIIKQIRISKNLSIYLFIYLSIQLFIYRFIYLYIYLFIYLSIYLSIYLFI